MKPRLFVPDSFAVGLAILDAVLFVFPSLRVAGALAGLLAFAYWLLMVALKIIRR